ncbi:MAG: RNA methyltransferase [Clostridiales bacterium]|nr:RNA methyltransferase [Clostridiales bacterium]
MKKEAEKLNPSTLFEGMVSIRPLFNGNAKRKIEKMWIDKANQTSKNKSKELSFLQHKAEELSFPIEFIASEELAAMALGTTHGGVIAACTQRKIPALTLPQIKPKGFYVYLDGIEDPYNFGYALRSLYAAGVDAVILSPRNWMSAAGVVCRASAGASELFDLYEADGIDAAALFHQAGYQVIGTGLEKAASMYETPLTFPLFLIIGGEKRGISKSLYEKCDHIVKIEYGRDCAFSLSAASAAAILAFEAARQNFFNH